MHACQTDLFAPPPTEPSSPGRPPADPLLHRRRDSSGPALRRTFAVGRSGPRTRELRFAEGRRPPMPGPWALKAVVSGS